MLLYISEAVLKRIRRFIGENRGKIIAGAIITLFVTGLILYFIPITRYIIIQGYHQIKIVTGRKSISSVLGKSDLDPKTRAKLNMVQEVKDFGITLGLNNTSSYRTLYDTGGKPVVYSISACAKDRLSPYVWRFPIVGTVPYLGFFNKEDAKKEVRKLENKNLDVIVSYVSAYSTLGILPDPLYSSMLTGSDENLADTILHEMTHETIFIKNEIKFNESLACFIGDTGSVEFLKFKYGENSEAVKQALDKKHDNELFSNFIEDLYKEMKEYYGSSISKEEKIKGREELFARAKENFNSLIIPQMKTKNYEFFEKVRLNNAYLILNHSYHGDYDMIKELYNKQSCDLKKTIEYLKSIKNEIDIRGKIRGELKERLYEKKM
jgi:predicted aminopeptidase